MAVCRVEKNKNYTTMSNYHLRDRNLSNKARGLLSTMLSLPEEWDYTTRGLAAICKDGVDGITAQLKELEYAGYLERHRVRDEKGHICDMEYVIYEKPQPKPDSLSPNTPSPDTGNPHTDSPHTETPDTGLADTALPRQEKPAQINKDKSITEKSNTDESNIDSIPSDVARPSVLEALEMKRRETNRDREAYRKLILDNIEYDILVHDRSRDRDRIDELVSIMVDTVCSTKKFVRVGGEDLPAEVVKSRLLKLDREHILFVLDCLNENTTKIRNIRQYLLTALYNAPITIGNYYASLVNHDMYGTAYEGR